MTILSINQSQLVSNKNVNRSAVEHIANYPDSAGRVARSIQVVQKTAKLVNEIRKETGNQISLPLAVIDGQCNAALSMIGVVTLPGVTLSAIQSIADLRTKNTMPGEFARKAVKAVRDGSTAFVSYGYAVGLLVNNPVLKNVVNIVDVTSDVADGALVVQDLQKSSAMLDVAVAENAPEVVQAAIAHTKYYAMIKLAKIILSLVSGILGLALLAVGAPFIPAIALIAISLTSAIFAIASHFYKETRPYEIIDFFKPNNDPKLIPATLN